MALRARARDADVGEAMSVLQNVEFKCYDAPGVLVHNPSPVQQFLRRVILAIIKLDYNSVG